MSNAGSNVAFVVSTCRESCELNDVSLHQPVEAYSKQIDNVIYLHVSTTGYFASSDIWRQRMLI